MTLGVSRRGAETQRVKGRAGWPRLPPSAATVVAEQREAVLCRLASSPSSVARDGCRPCPCLRTGRMLVIPDVTLQRSAMLHRV